MIKFGSLPSQTGLRAFTNYLIDIENVCILENHDGRDYDRKSMIVLNFVLYKWEQKYEFQMEYAK
ncbi:hypothetical protein QR98_0099590 [Sarcoptes scabiei]|uniref:Uncharacterized protein n=1 Tax=Sarcoptes scabiei TaxID=52283 RepID=A0A132AK39_SARSC|nr:hypothetical protein QR98_0099590 [Sarcoptes scabiei]